MKVCKRLCLILTCIILSSSAKSQEGRFDLSLKQYQNPWRIGEFKALVEVEGTLLSYAACPTFPAGAMTRAGEYWFTTNLSSGETSYLNYKNAYNAEVRLSEIYRNNCGEHKKDKIYSSFYDNTNDVLTLLETSMVNGEMRQRKQVFNGTFETKTNGAIETFEIDEYFTGTGLIIFSAISTYTNNKKLFIGKISNSKLWDIDLTELDNQFENPGRYRGVLQGKNVYQSWSPYCVFNNDYNNLTTAFISINLPGTEKVLKAIQLDETTGDWKMSEYNFTIGSNFERYPNNWVQGGEIYFLPSGGFCTVSRDSDGRGVSDNTFSISYFNQKLKLKQKGTLNNFEAITYVNEVGGYIIVGGYTNTKGYLGYPNPVITVLYKGDLSVTYTKFFALKNGTVDLIRTNGQSVFIAIAGFFGTAEERVEPVKPCIIVDKLNNAGLFENDLFE